MRNGGLAKSQARIEIAWRNINHLRYAEYHSNGREQRRLKSLLRVKKEQEKAGLKFNIQNTKIMASFAITSWQIDGETMETVRLYILGL